MPVRAALNIAYAMLMDGRDADDRKKLDDQLHGWGEMQERANRVLRGGEG